MVVLVTRILPTMFLPRLQRGTPSPARLAGRLRHRRMTMHLNGVFARIRPDIAFFRCGDGAALHSWQRYPWTCSVMPEVFSTSAMIGRAKEGAAQSRLLASRPRPRRH